jgi:hypothetical protein
MDIAAMSILLNQGKVQQQAGISVMKLAMDTSKTQGNALASLLGETAKALERAVQPYLGASVDVRA